VAGWSRSRDPRPCSQRWSCPLPAARWGFEGFLPRSGSERRARLARLATDERTTILFEAPTRTAATLRDLAAACGEARPAALCRELTKLHEEVRRGPLADLAAEAQRRPPRGEVTLVVGGRLEAAGAAQDGHPEAGDLAAARRRVAALAGGLSRAAASKQVAAETGLARRDLYDVS
jgi:16S rRNA (cytidine1402-2'-O)-methyltransferase